MVLTTDWAQVEVIDLINDGSGLAFGIIGGRSTGVVVKTIVPGGVADRDGRLQSGDHILQIGEVNLRGLGSEQVASVLRQCGVHVRMVVARPVESTSADYQALGSNAPIVPTKILGDPVELDKHLNDNGYGEIYMQNPSNSYATPYIYTGQQTDVQLHTISGLVDVVRNPLPIGSVPSLPPQSLPPVTAVDLLPLDMALRNSQPETEVYGIELTKDELGLGITVAGYVCEKEEISGIFVKSISKGSAADVSGMIKINDRIIEVNGRSVLGHTNHQAVEILRKTGNKVNIRFERYLRGPKYEQLQQAILANELRPASPPSPSASSLPKIPLSLVRMSSLGIEPEGESRTSFDFDSAVLQDLETPTNENNEIVIDTADGRRSVQFSICSHESIHDKWRRLLRVDVDIVIAEMTKEATSGLGISLEGTVDVEDGHEVRPHHYIRNILPNGPVGINGVLQSGDELLEVNGIQLLGLNHLEVVSILKQLPSLVILVCARHSILNRIIDTSQHRDAFEARNILAGNINTLMHSTEKLVKAKSDTSIASSVVSETCCSLGSRSRSLELVAGLPMWSDEPTMVILNKGDHGLGFSILDYQDPLNPSETVIVIRSLIPGGVAQQDGRLIPGDRLLAVNDINVEHASLDRAVQVLKGASRGAVKITVAKPLSINDSISHHSQDTEDDQTCIDDFQECIEEYQECLEVVQICIEEDRSFNHSPCLSQVEDFGVKQQKNDEPNNSESYKSVCDNNRTPIKTDSAQKCEDSEKDGYETCLDESFSDEVAKMDDKTPTNSTCNLTCKTEGCVDLGTVKEENEIELNKHQLEIEIAQVNEELRRVSKKKESLKRKERKKCTGEARKLSEDCDDVFDSDGRSSTNPISSDKSGDSCVIEIGIDNAGISDTVHNGETLISFNNVASSAREDSFLEVDLPRKPPDIESSNKAFKKIKLESVRNSEGSTTDENVQKRIKIKDTTEFRLKDVSLKPIEFLEEIFVIDDDTIHTPTKSTKHVTYSERSNHTQSSFAAAQQQQEVSKVICSIVEQEDVKQHVLNTNVGLNFDEPKKTKKKRIKAKSFDEPKHDMNIVIEHVVVHEPKIFTVNSHASSEPCLNSDSFEDHHICLDTNQDDELNSYENTNHMDEFFLVQFPDDMRTEKSYSEPNVVDRLNAPITYRYRIAEYYNDIEDCLRSFSENQKPAGESVKKAELRDEDVFGNIFLPIRCKSAPDVLDNSFVTLTYDPGPRRTRRKSLFLPGYVKENENVQMTVNKIVDTPISIARSPDASGNNMLEKHWAPQRTVQIFREPNTSLGISIVGGKVDLYRESESETILGIFIKNVVTNSPAGRSGQLKTGDRILEVSGTSLKNVSHERAVEIIKYAKNPVTFVVQSIVPHGDDGHTKFNAVNCTMPFSSTPATSGETGGPSRQKSLGLSSQKSVEFSDSVIVNSIEPDTRAPSPDEVHSSALRREKTVESSEESDDDEEDVRELEGRTVSAKGHEIDRASAANIKRTKEEAAADPEEEDDFGYTTNKVKKKYSNLGHSILMVQLERAVGQGLGLSLAGHKDRNCMAVFVCGINPTGAAYRAGGIQVGDEILEVNGVVLHGRCHLNASAIIKGLSGPIFKVIILRRKAAVDDIAVRPITQFPVSLAEEASEESFSNYPNVRTIAIKKGSQSLGIMIIEGKHAEVGQGIFISDIQVGSSAEKVGLEIGEMILAVNKDSLLGSNYDTAANLLKRTEGLVTLVVSNPGKRATTPVPDGEKSSVGKGLKPGSTASRPTTPTPEPPADPATCPITPGRDTTIEINTENKLLALFFVGGKDTSIPGIMLVDMYPGGEAQKDGRLQPGDQILEANGTSLKDVTHNTAAQALRQTLPKVKLLVYRPEKPEYQTVEVELVKKPGKGLGISCRRSPKGIYITEVLVGGTADVDAKLMRGDFLISANGQTLESLNLEEGSALLKTLSGKVAIKAHRCKPAAR